MKYSLQYQGRFQLQLRLRLRLQYRHNHFLACYLLRLPMPKLLLPVPMLAVSRGRPDRPRSAGPNEILRGEQDCSRYYI